MPIEFSCDQSGVYRASLYISAQDLATISSFNFGPIPDANTLLVPFFVAIQYGANNPHSGYPSNYSFVISDSTGTSTVNVSIAAYQTGAEPIITPGMPGIATGQLDVYFGAPGVYGPISSSNVTSGNAGLGYAVNDTGTIYGGDGTATYQVLTIGVGGSVATYTLTANGNSYTTTAGEGTTATTGAGTGLQLDITVTTAGTGDVQFDVLYYAVEVLAT